MDTESKISWFRHLMKCKRISEIPESMPDKRKDCDTEGSAQAYPKNVSDLFDMKEEKTGPSSAFD